MSVRSEYIRPAFQHPEHAQKGEYWGISNEKIATYQIKGRF